MSRINIAKTLPRIERRSSASQRDIFRQRRAIDDAHVEILANRAGDRRLKQDQLQRLGVLKLQEIEIHHAFELRRQIEIRAAVGDENSRIHEIRLPLEFARSHARQQAVRRSE